MKVRVIAGLLLGTSVFAADAPMTNQDVMKMVASGVSQDLILTTIRNSEPHFNLMRSSMDQLMKAGVPEQVIRAIAARQNGSQPAHPATEAKATAPRGTKDPVESPAGLIARPVTPSTSAATTPVAAAPPFMARPTSTQTFNAELIGLKGRTGGSLVVAPDRLTFNNLQIPAAQVSNIVYERASRPRYAAGLLLAWPLLFTKSKQHFLTVQHGDYSVFKLDKNDYRQVLAAVEAATGRKIERQEER